MILTFDAWKDIPVAPTIHSVSVLPARPGLPEEPIAPNLFASLIHPDHSGYIWTVRFSADGKRLFSSGYPNGIVEIWDVASRHEIIRIDTPPGGRGDWHYALLTPDWKTIYVPVAKRNISHVERDGKILSKINYTGEIRVWDATSGKELEPLRSAEGKAPWVARLAPDGRHLVSLEEVSYVTSDPLRATTVLWDLTTKTKLELNNEFDLPVLSPDLKTAITKNRESKGKPSFISLIDVASGKELARRDCPYKDRAISASRMSPDGALIVAQIGGKKGAPVEVLLLDARTLEVRGKFEDAPDPDGLYVWRYSEFTPDGKRFVLCGAGGKLLVWDVAAQKLERTLTYGSDLQTWQIAFSPDSRTIAIGWSPKPPSFKPTAADNDPLDYPQPRVSLVDLDGKSPTRVLIAPRGGAASLAFSPDGKTLAMGSMGAIRLFDLTK